MSTQNAESSRSQVCWIKSVWAANACRCSTCPLPKGHNSHSTAPSFRPRSPNWGQAHLAKSRPKKTSSQCRVSSASRLTATILTFCCARHTIQAMPGFRFLARIRLHCRKGNLMEGVKIKPDRKKRLLATFPFSKTRVEQIDKRSDNGGEERGWIDGTKVTGIHPR